MPTVGFTSSRAMFLYILGLDGLSSSTAWFRIFLFSIMGPPPYNNVGNEVHGDTSLARRSRFCTEPTKTAFSLGSLILVMRIIRSVNARTHFCFKRGSLVTEYYMNMSHIT